MDGFTGKEMLLKTGVLRCALSVACALGMIESPQWVLENMLAHQLGQQVSIDSQASGDSSRSTLGLITGDPEAAKIWKRFNRNGLYRVARGDDFRSSPENYRPYGDGDFNRDHQSYDFAAIVVDTTRTDSSRFGIVIFNARKGRQRYDGPYWLFRGSDLSRTSLNTSSHGPLLVGEHLDDGTIKVCVVKWNRRKREYRCDKAR